MQLKYVLLTFMSLLSTPVLADEVEYCSEPQIATIKSSVSLAKIGMRDAVAALESPSETTVERYVEWFGAPASDKIERVRDVYQKALSYIDFQTFICPKKSFPGDDWTPDDIAATTPGDSFSIEVLPNFFDLTDTGENSRPGVIVHEMSHHKVVGDTDDNGEYGANAARARATTDPELALNTASNYQFFIVSILSGM